MSDSPYMTVTEATEYLRVSAATLRRWAREGPPGSGNKKLTRVRLSSRKLLYLREEITALAEENYYRIGA